MAGVVDDYVCAEMCRDCPFHTSGPGKHLADSLAKGRLESIKVGLLDGDVFHCHKTTHETGDGTEKICRGALQFQIEHGAVPQAVQIGERLAALQEGRQARW